MIHQLQRISYFEDFCIEFQATSSSWVRLYEAYAGTFHFNRWTQSSSSVLLPLNHNPNTSIVVGRTQLDEQ